MKYYLNKKTNEIYAFEPRDIFPDPQPMQDLEGKPILNADGTPAMQPAQTSALNQAIYAALAEGFELMTDAQFADWRQAQVQAAAQAAAAYIPPAVTMRQARLVLLGAGLLPQIDKAIAGMPSPQREAATIEWEYSSEVKRDGALVQQLGKSLGLDDAALDAMFKRAATL